MFQIHMLTAGRGDSFWIEYGDRRTPHRVLIDGGIHRTSAVLRERIEALPEDQRHFDLLVVTHIDLDHIAGTLPVFREPPAGLRLDDVWYNGWRHLPSPPEDRERRLLGPRQGEQLAALIEEHDHPWNAKLGGGAVALRNGDAELPVILLAGGMKLTLLGPRLDRLAALRPVWEKEIRKAGLEPGQAGGVLEEAAARPRRKRLLGAQSKVDVAKLAALTFVPDTSEANGSSIAFLAEYGGKRCLFTGDAFAGDVLASVRRLARAESETSLAVDAFKLSHHGGSKNTSVELIQALACKRFLFSTDGTIYGHPEKETVARVIVHGRKLGAPELNFNVRSDESGLWDDRRLFTDPKWRYEPVLPPANSSGLAVEL